MKFNPNNKDSLMLEEIMEDAMLITDEQTASEYVKNYTQYIMDNNFNLSEERARKIALNNIGYYAGYKSHETRDQIEKVFGCEHPIFGSIAKNGIPDPTEAFKLGMEYGKANKMTDEQKTFLIQRCQNFGELVEAFKTIGIVDGSRKKYTSDRLIEKLDQIRMFMPNRSFERIPFNLITRTYGIRAKTIELFYYEVNGI